MSRKVNLKVYTHHCLNIILKTTCTSGPLEVCRSFRTDTPPGPRDDSSLAKPTCATWQTRRVSFAISSSRLSGLNIKLIKLIKHKCRTTCEKNRYAFALNFPALLRENHRNQYQSPTSNGTHLSNIRMIPKSAKFRTVLCGTFLWLPNTAQTAQIPKFCRTRGTGGTFSLHRFMSQSSKSFMWISPPPPGLPPGNQFPILQARRQRRRKSLATEKNMKKWVPNSLDSG